MILVLHNARTVKLKNNSQSRFRIYIYRMRYCHTCQQPGAILTKAREGSPSSCQRDPFVDALRLIS